MIDIFGVGVCIACISYICCVYTTFITLSARPLFTSDICCDRKHCVHVTKQAKQNNKPPKPKPDKNAQPKSSQQQRCSPNGLYVQTSRQLNCLCVQTSRTHQRNKSTGSIPKCDQNCTGGRRGGSMPQTCAWTSPMSSSGSSKCGCAAASSRLHSAEPTAPVNRKKICLVASSFLDYDGSDDGLRRKKSICEALMQPGFGKG